MIIIMSVQDQHRTV